MKPEEIKCFKSLFILAGITVALILPFSKPFYVLIEYWPLNIFVMLTIFATDVILSFYLIVRTSREVRRNKNGSCN